MSDADVVQPVRRREFTRPAVLAALGAWFGFLSGPNVMVAATNSNFLRVLPEAVHFDRTAISTCYAVVLWLNALLLPVGGRLIDRFGLRAVVLPGIFLFGACFMLLGQVQSLAEFVMLQLLLAVPCSMHASPAYAKLISLWFDRNRGLVLGLCVALGAGLGQSIMPKLAQWMIDTYGWRGGYIGIGFLVLLIGFPPVALLARTPKGAQKSKMNETPAEAQQTAAQARAGQIGASRAEAIRQPVFYQVFAAIMFASMALLATVQHVIPMLTERGLPLNLATTVMSFMFIGVIFGQFSSGFVVDRVNTPRVILPYFISALIGVLVLYSQTRTTVLLPGALMMGLGLGGEISQNAYLVSRYFGLKAFGAIYGLTFAASAIGNGTGTILLGYLRDRLGNYGPGLYLTGGAMVISVLCIALLPKFVYDSPRRKT